MDPLKPKDVINQLRYEFEQKLKGGGITWNKEGILQAFDRAHAAAAMWYADQMMEMRDEQTR